jgi:hypothetical protein
MRFENGYFTLTPEQRLVIGEQTDMPIPKTQLPRIHSLARSAVDKATQKDMRIFHRLHNNGFEIEEIFASFDLLGSQTALIYDILETGK